MRRFRRGTWIGLTVVCLLTLAAGAHAHLTGAFVEFLATVHDESTIEKLKQAMADTRAEIDRLVPRIEQLQTEYESSQKIAVDKLLFYSEMGLDTWMTLLLQEEEPVDILGSLWLIERNLDAYKGELNELYLTYKQLLATKESLQGHESLLAVIEENLQVRQTFLAENTDLDLEQLANYLDIDWMSEVEPKILEMLKKDRELTQTGIGEWAASGEGSFPYRLTQNWLNERSDLEYFFRSDHVYVVFKQPDLHVILIGQVLQDEDGRAASLVYEAGFFNGFMMPQTLINKLQGFQIPYDQLRLLPGLNKPFYLRQASGELLVRTEGE